MCAYCDEKSERSPCSSCVPLLQQIQEAHEEFPEEHSNRFLRGGRVNPSSTESRIARVQEMAELAARKLPLFANSTRERYHPSRPETYKYKG